ncbi:MAG: hydratase, partial [Desulfovibrionaceae bacterium]|nr:hydratase [Desulfovibrionaceae bacterium]
HSTRNFPNREGSKPGNGQLSGVALMDARSIAATAANGGRLTAATELDWDKIQPALDYSFDPIIYATRCYQGYGKPDTEAKLVYGPNITDWPTMSALPEHLLLSVCCVINDPVTTTDELIPSGETSSLRSNPRKLSEFTLSRRDPEYVGRAKAVQALEECRTANPADAALAADIAGRCEALKAASPEIYAKVFGGPDLANVGIGSTIFAVKPGDGSAREQAASCQKVVGGWANLAEEYATKRYRSNLINWGMVPFLMEPGLGEKLENGDTIVIPDIRRAIAEKQPSMEAWLIHDGKASTLTLATGDLTDDERTIILAGCLINFYRDGN